MVAFQVCERQGVYGKYPDGDFENEKKRLQEMLDTFTDEEIEKLYIKEDKEHICLNLPFSFDIETTSWKTTDGKNEIKHATMYVFVFGINGIVVVGRTWEEFNIFLSMVMDKFKCGIDRHIIIYVHNLGYEFQFIRKHFHWVSVFAIDQRSPAKAITDTGLEFKDSLVLSGYSLAKVSEHLAKYKVKKMVGDLDYRLLRNKDTPLTEKEWGYVFNDGLVVMAYIKEEMERNKDKISKIPMTNTGYVRRYVRDCCLYENPSNHKIGVAKYQDYVSIMRNLTLEKDEYTMLKDCFQGGFTHANAFNSGITMKDVTSMDFTSSYPSVMICEMFPMSKGEKVEVKSKDDFEYYLDHYCCMFYVEFLGLQSKEIGDNPISLSRCLLHEGDETDNGRIYKANKVGMVITEVDYEVYKKFYSWLHMNVGTMYIYEKWYLPSSFVLSILKLYHDKTTLKGVDEKYVEYMHSKGNLNACYGMTVTDVCRNEDTYSEEDGWEHSPCLDVEGTLEKYNQDRRRVLFYPWGIWVTAYARRNLFSGIYALKGTGDYIYADTDSIKMLNYKSHKKYFDDYNETLKKKMIKAMDYHKLPYDMIEPSTIKGEKKLLGAWDYDGHYDYFKTLGAKRYISVENGNIHITISGVNKRCGQDFLTWKYGNVDNVLEHFDSSLVFDNEYMKDGIIHEGSGKNVHTYIDDEDIGELTDYLGNKSKYYEMSSVYMEATSYSMSIAEGYANFLFKMRRVKYGEEDKMV